MNFYALGFVVIVFVLAALVGCRLFLKYFGYSYDSSSVKNALNPQKILEELLLHKIARPEIGFVP